jgi:hypothetical protein
VNQEAIVRSHLACRSGHQMRGHFLRGWEGNMFVDVPGKYEAGPGFGQTQCDDFTSIQPLVRSSCQGMMKADDVNCAAGAIGVDVCANCIQLFRIDLAICLPMRGFRAAIRIQAVKCDFAAVKGELKLQRIGLPEIIIFNDGLFRRSVTLPDIVVPGYVEDARIESNAAAGACQMGAVKKGCSYQQLFGFASAGQIAGMHDYHRDASLFAVGEDAADFDCKRAGHFEGVGEAALQRRLGNQFFEDGKLVVDGWAEMQVGDVDYRRQRGFDHPVMVTDLAGGSVMELVGGVFKADRANDS